MLDINEHSSHQAEITERYRISRELHDHLGHDLTRALLGLQAYEYISDTKESEKLLQEVKKRLENSTKSLRDIVHNITPTTSIGVERLENIIAKFNYINIDFKKTGDMSLVPAYKWYLLETCLKEALTNIVRHSYCTKVCIDLSVIKSIVRLSVRDNGIIKKNNLPGSGFRNLQMRARFLGGSLTFMNRKDGFLLVCVIPLEKEELTNETFNSR